MPAWINRYKPLETSVGGGFYALRLTRHGSKLVKADRSPLSHNKSLMTEPQRGIRLDKPRRHRARSPKD